MYSIHIYIYILYIYIYIYIYIYLIDSPILAKYGHQFSGRVGCVCERLLVLLYQHKKMMFLK